MHTSGQNVFLKTWQLVCMLQYRTLCPVGRFVPWDVLSMRRFVRGTFCPIDVLSVGPYVWGPYVHGTFCPVGGIVCAPIFTRIPRRTEFTAISLTCNAVNR